MAQRVVLTEDGPACPRCGSTTFRTKSVLEWGRSRLACAGCGTGLLPATRGDVRAARRRATPVREPVTWGGRAREHDHEWRDVTTADDRRNGVVVFECPCGKGRTESA